MEQSLVSSQALERTIEDRVRNSVERKSEHDFRNDCQGQHINAKSRPARTFLNVLRLRQTLRIRRLNEQCLDPFDFEPAKSGYAGPLLYPLDIGTGFW